MDLMAVERKMERRIKKGVVLFAGEIEKKESYEALDREEGGLL